jgi:peptidoglycan-N-acetylglucosamine deacetylase
VVHERRVEWVERPPGEALGRSPEPGEVIGHLGAALAVRDDVLPRPLADAEPEAAEDPLEKRGADHAIPPARAVVGPVLVLEDTAEAAHLGSSYHDPGGAVMAKEIFVAYGIDVDAVAGWLGSYGGENSPDDISRGLFAGEVGTPRLLKLFDRYDLKTTWFIPGHSIETFPSETEQVVAAGHEIGIHGYTHENPIAMTREQETAVLDKCIELVERISGKRPTGYVAPWWEFSNVTNELLLERGIKYDHSLMHHDFVPYYVRVGDSWTKIDYAKRADEWMVPLQRGEETDLIEIPASWYLDDLPPMMFIKTAPNSHGFVNPRDIEQLWMDQFDWVYREYDYAVFTMTIHPDVSGRPAVLAMHERIIEHINGHDGIRWATFDEIADDFAKRSPRSA